MKEQIILEGTGFIYEHKFFKNKSETFTEFKDFYLLNKGKDNKVFILKFEREISFDISELDYYHLLKKTIKIVKLDSIWKMNRVDDTEYFYKIDYNLTLETKDEL